LFVSFHLSTAMIWLKGYGKGLENRRIVKIVNR
jgi:hypothetical protein